MCDVTKKRLLNRLNPLTPRSDYHVTSPNSTHTLSSKQVMRTLKFMGKSCHLDLTPNFPTYFTRKCVAARGEN